MPSAVPGRNLHGGNTSTPGPASEARGLVQWAIDRRQQGLDQGWSRIGGQHVHRALGRLRAWLERNPYPGRDSLRQFWKEHELDIRLVMPARSRKRLDRLQQLILSQ